MIGKQLIQHNIFYGGLNIPYILIDNIVLYLENKGYSDYEIVQAINNFDFPHATYSSHNGALSKLVERYYSTPIF